MILTVFYLALLVLISIYGFYWVYGVFKGAPYYPSNKHAIAQMLEFAQLKPESKVAELGSGDGRLAIKLAKAGFEVTAYEINPIFTIITRLIAMLRRVPNLKIKQEDFLKADLSKYDIVVTYLYPGIMQKLEKKLYSELKSGSLVITNTFSMQKKKPLKKGASKILLYKID
ncbi:MAG: rRNA adenine N-6-methyltransferase family protein [Candidatus Dojkabacteria bacterium]